MRKRIATFGLALASAYVLAADSPRFTYQYAGLTLGGLSGEENAMGCSCSFFSQESRLKHRPLLNWSIETPSPKASMFIDGRLVKLEIAEAIALPPRRNAPISCRLVGSRTKVNLRLTTTAVCDGTTGCDGTGYEGSMVVAHGNMSVTIPVTGGCGC
jgi:hypothetical protein